MVTLGLRFLDEAHNVIQHDVDRVRYQVDFITSLKSSTNTRFTSGNTSRQTGELDERARNGLVHDITGGDDDHNRYQESDDGRQDRRINLCRSDSRHNLPHRLCSSYDLLPAISQRSKFLIGVE